MKKSFQMKNLKLLNKSYLSVTIISLFFAVIAHSQEPADIWNIEEKKDSKKVIIIENPEVKNTAQNSIYEMQSNKKKKLDIKETETLTSNEIKIVGLYDPAENGLSINMWSNSNEIGRAHV